MIVSDVAGGIKKYMTAFFTEGGIFVLNANETNQLHDLLELFNSLEKLVNTTDDCLNKLLELK